MSLLINNKLIAFGIFCLLIFAYHQNHSLLEEGDTQANNSLPIALLTYGELSFSPIDFPDNFSWFFLAEPGDETRVIRIHRWDQNFKGKPIEEWRKMKEIRLRKEAYFLVRSEKRDTYVNTFGPVSGLTAVPLFVFLNLIDPNFFNKSPLVLSAAKLQASAMVAFSAVLIFLIGLQFISRARAMFIALSYGLCTCVFSISSQNLWQQTVNLFFITLGCYYLFKIGNRIHHTILCGFMFGAAVACRTTSLLMLIPVFVYLFLYHRKESIIFAVFASILPAAMAFYNNYYFDSPFVFGQSIVGHQLAAEKTGYEDLFQTPLQYGAMGQLFSPSRGLFIYSPFLVFSLWGAVKAWLAPEYRMLRPLTIGVVAIACLQFMWFDWWGGWTYGYRPLVDLVPLLTLFILPITEKIFEKKYLFAIFSLALLWSFYVQSVGAYAYDKDGWNERRLHSVMLTGWDRRMVLEKEEAMELIRKHGGKYLEYRRCNIDFNYCRYRLWSWEDNPITYYVEHLEESHQERIRPGWDLLSIFGESSDWRLRRLNGHLVVPER